MNLKHNIMLNRKRGLLIKGRKSGCGFGGNGYKKKLDDEMMKMTLGEGMHQKKSLLRPLTFKF